MEARVGDRQVLQHEVRFVRRPGGVVLQRRLEVQRAVLEPGVERHLAGLDAVIADEERQVPGVERRQRQLDVLWRVADREVAEPDPAVAERHAPDEHAPSGACGFRFLGWRGVRGGGYEEHAVRAAVDAHGEPVELEPAHLDDLAEERQDPEVDRETRRGEDRRSGGVSVANTRNPWRVMPPVSSARSTSSSSIRPTSASSAWLTATRRMT